eukprot:gnl/Hemi2/12350_TR4227_c0_g1_i1.p1 gnl/Hemi2/12350_TR4227_c0_g1~~gnl/Hemi2/12350_TR4227_c0_g1_i1.p1  ORF type:complete len:219 (-),score=64.49 gnl/Hemi2/12350_TR4227_c0_g1_i1:89-745(-)
MTTHVCGESMGLFFSAAFVDVKKCIVVASLVMLTGMLIGGFYVNSDNIPSWLRWLQYLSFIKYSYEAAVINDLSRSQTWTCANPTAFTTCPISGNTIITSRGMNPNNMGLDVGIMFVIIFLFRIGAYTCLRFLNQPLPILAVAEADQPSAPSSQDAASDALQPHLAFARSESVASDAAHSSYPAHNDDPYYASYPAVETTTAEKEFGGEDTNRYRLSV